MGVCSRRDDLVKTKKFNFQLVFYEGLNIVELSYLYVVGTWFGAANVFPNGVVEDLGFLTDVAH